MVRSPAATKLRDEVFRRLPASGEWTELKRLFGDVLCVLPDDAVEWKEFEAEFDAKHRETSDLPFPVREAIGHVMTRERLLGTVLYVLAIDGLVRYVWDEDRVRLTAAGRASTAATAS